MYQHIFVAFLLLSNPILNIFILSLSKENRNTRFKQSMYSGICAWYLFLTVLIILFKPLDKLFFIQHTIEFNGWTIFLFCLIGFYLVASNVLPFLFHKNDEVLNNIRSSYQKNAHRYPTTRKENMTFLLIPVMVGISEELLFRSYLYEYVQADLFHFSPWVSFLFLSFLFGSLHFHQGVVGIISSTLFGLFMGFLFNLTGNLMLPIILHIIIDLKIVFISIILQRKQALNI